MSDEYSPIRELNLLKELQDRLGDVPYSGEFALIDYGDPSYFRDFAAAEIRERMIPFARANDASSFYALWRCDDRDDLATLPVIFCGDEGEIFMEASGLHDLFRLLALDGAHLGGGDVDEEDLTEGHHEYLAWLRDNFGLTPARDAAAINKAAYDAYGRPFAEWLLRHEPGWPGTMEDMLKELGDRWLLL